MSHNQVPKSRFKAKALELMRQVEASGESLVVTDHGKPTLEVRPFRHGDRSPFSILRGTVVRYVDPTEPVDVDWEASE